MGWAPGTRRCAVAALLALTLLLANVGSAGAHANLERSQPNANQVLAEQPKQVFLWFSEEPELRLTELQLLDPTGKTIASLAARGAPGDTRAVTANLPEISPGTYVVSWKATSAVDGHTTRGGFPFTYGVGQVPASVTAPGLAAAATYSPSPTGVIGRFLTFTGSIALVGGIAFGPLVLWPAVGALPSGRRRRGAPSGAERAADLGVRGLRLIGLLALPSLVLGTALMALTQASESADVPLLAAIGEPLARVALGTRYGAIFGARLACVLLLAALFPFLLRSTSRLLHGAALLVAAGLLLTLSLGAHAAAASTLTPLVIGLDWVHLVAGSVWLGGLVLLCLLAAGLTAEPDRGTGRVDALAGLVTRFSVVSSAVLIVALTGLIQSAINVGPSTTALFETPYGQALLAKVLLVAGMAGLGFYHWRVLGPRLSRAAASALALLAERFRWTALLEVALGALVLFATGYITAQQPARDAAVALRHVTVRGTADDLTFTLTATPGEAGLNHVELRVGGPGPLQAVEKVVLRASHLEMDMGEQEIELKPTGGGVYVVDGGQFSMAGQWQVEPLVRRTGREDARVPLVLPIAEPLGSSVDQSQPFELTPRMVLGVEAAVFGLILVVAASQLRRRSVRASWSALAGGVIAIGLGGYVTAAAFAAEQASPARRTNPVTMDAAALARGRLLYQQNCLSCHGVAGRGDGPLGRSLNPRPADLRIHVTQHPEGQIFDWITNGFPGTAMPAFKDQIAEDDRWRLVGFIKGFAEDGPAPAQTAAAGLRLPGAPAGSTPAAQPATTAPSAGTPIPSASGTPAAAGAPPRVLARPIAGAAGATAAAALVNGRDVTVRITPDQYRRGETNQVAIELAGGDAPLRYQLTMAGHPMPPDEGETRALGGGRYELPPAARFDMAGEWRLDLEVDRQAVTFWLTVGDDGRLVFAEP